MDSMPDLQFPVDAGVSLSLDGRAAGLIFWTAAEDFCLAYSKVLLGRGWAVHLFLQEIHSQALIIL